MNAFMYRHDMNDWPVVFFKDYFQKHSEKHNYKTRHINDLQLTNNKKTFQIEVLEQMIPFFGIFYQKH